MNISFAKKMPNGDPTGFREKVLNKIKTSTIRNDPTDRIQVGKKLHLCENIRTKNYNCFAQAIVTKVERVNIYKVAKLITPASFQMTDLLDESYLLTLQIATQSIIRAEGFSTSDEFFSWFSIPQKNLKLIEFELL